MTLEIEPWAALGTRRTVTLACGTPQFGYPEPRLEQRITELEPGIMYVDIDRISDADWRAALPQLSAARGIVFDMRGYPRGTPAWLGNLSQSPMDSPQWHVPTPALPDRIRFPFAQSGWTVPPAQPYLSAKKVFLIDSRCISYMETTMGIIEAYGLGEIIGSPTAGTNGNVNPFTIPGGYTLVWTGMKVLKHDGSQHHGIGIRPTIPHTRTREGIAAGRDELLLRGIEVLKGQ